MAKQRRASWVHGALVMGALMLASAATLRPLVHPLLPPAWRAAPLLNVPLRTWGRLDKAGLPASLARLSTLSRSEIAAAQASPPEWAHARLLAHTNGTAPPPPPPPWCTLLINHDWRVVFLKCGRGADG